MSIDSISPPFFGTVRDVRAWLIEGGNPNGQVAELPLLVWYLNNGTSEGIAELLAAGANPNQRTQDGRGWIHWCVETHQPEWLIQTGLPLLDNDWCIADISGKTPFHLGKLAPGIGQTLAARWWTEGRDWEKLNHPESPESAAIRENNPALARVWRGWARALVRG